MCCSSAFHICIACFGRPSHVYISTSDFFGRVCFASRLQSEIGEWTRFSDGWREYVPMMVSVCYGDDHDCKDKS